MVVEGKVVVCPQCGKKFKLKAGFAAKSFACSGCSATVWVEGKPAASPKGRGAKVGRSRRRVAAAKVRAPEGRGRGRRAEPAEDDEERPRGHYQRPDNKGLHITLAVIGLIGCVAVGFFLFGSQKTKADKKKAAAAAREAVQNDTDPAYTRKGSSGDRPNMPEVAGGDDKTGGTSGEPSKSGGTTDPDGGGAPPDDGSASSKPTAKLGTGRKKGSKRRNWAPPADLPHLESTPPDLRKKIDEYIVLMNDPMAGRDSLDAKQKLIAIGKPAFPRILGAMAKIRDTITDVDSMDERLIESSLKLGDSALREMDGYLSSYDKGLLKPGTDKKYIEYILKLHYKRWINDLQKLDEMPGPYEHKYGDEEDEDVKKGPR